MDVCYQDWTLFKLLEPLLTSLLASKPFSKLFKKDVPRLSQINQSSLSISPAPDDFVPAIYWESKN